MKAVWVLVLVLLVSGCATNADVTISLYEGEHYSVTSEMTIPTNLLNLRGGTQAFERQLDVEMANLAAETGAEQATWRRGESDNPDESVYINDVDGVGFNAGSEPIARVIDYEGRDALLFEDDSFSELQGVGTNVTVTLHGGEILESNGNRIDGDTVRWINPDEPLRAVLLPKSQFGLLPLAGLGAGILLVGVLGVGIFLARRRQQRAAPVYAPALEPSAWVPSSREAGGVPRPTSAPARDTAERVSLSIVYCPACGNPADAGTIFCIHCGNKIPAR
jgi:hypothetical protein